MPTLAAPLRNLRRKVFWCVIAVVLSLAGALVWLQSGKSSFPPLPEPNGYDILVTATARVVRPTNNPGAMATEELEKLVSLNQPALEQIRRGLALPCAVPVHMREDWFSIHTPYLINLKGAGLAFAAEAELQRRKNDPKAALETYADLLKLGQAGARHGVLITFLVGMACEATAVQPLTNLLTTLGAKECRRATQLLYEHDLQREPFDEMMRHEKEWSRRTYGPLRRLQVFFAECLSKNVWAGMSEPPDKVHHKRVREQRRLMLHFAERAFELEHGHLPVNAADLVPQILPALPLDPETEQPMQLPQPGAARPALPPR